VPPGRKYVGSIDEKTIGSRLRELRIRRGKTQADIAKVLKIDQSLISEYERGIVRLHGSLIVGLAEALRVSTDELLGMKKTPTNGSKDRRFLRRLEKVDRLSKRDKEALLGTIDAFLSKVS
jgi:transcriptional regulator with XRE-family HTH domain